MSAPPPFPHVPPALVDKLDELFPDRCARKGMTPEDIWLEAGARRVIDKLMSELKKQQDNSLKVP